MLQLQLFGGFKLSTENGQTVSIRLLKDRALFVYLALNTGKSFSRTALAGLLWSEQPEKNARHSLSQSLSAICDVLGAQASIVSRGRKEISLQKNVIQTDLESFLELAGQKEFDACCRAIDLYDDGLLGDIDFDEPAFDDWISAKKYEAQRTALESGLLVLGRSEQLDVVLGCDIAHKLVGIDPFCEVAHQYLIREHVRSGNLKMAHRQFEACKNRLVDELGIDPAPETRRALEPANNPIVTIIQPESDIDQTRSTPSLVVLPIDNISGDPSLDFLSLGLADDITTELTRYRDLFVISRESAFGLDIVRETSPVVCLRLGVRHCLRGAFRRVGN